MGRVRARLWHCNFFESYSLECPRCDAPLRGIIDPADDKLLVSGTESQNKTLQGLEK
jgi:hypothetical protein